MQKLTLISSLFGSALLFACTPDVPDIVTLSILTTGDATDSDSTTSGSTGGSTSTTANPTSGGGSEGNSSSSGGFVVEPDIPKVSMCDPYAQDCPDGEACKPASTDGDGAWDASICTKIMPNPGSVGDKCTVDGAVSGNDSCDKGAMCWNVNMEGEGVCVALCKGSPMQPSCDEAGTLCVIANDGVLNLCLPTCEPLLPDSCPGELCLPNPQGEAGYACILDASGDGGQIDQPCAYANGCKPGLLCVGVALSMKCDQGASGCCQPYCDKDMPPDGQCDVNGGQTCLDIYEMGMDPPGYENVGVCGIGM